MKIAIGIDTGGTCTDAVAFDFETKKVIAKSKTLTTKEDLSVGISKALDMLPAEYIKDAMMVSLSTTLATNACVEDKGGRAKLVIFGLTDELMERLKVEQTYGIKHGYVKCVDTHSAADGTSIDEPNWDELLAELNDWISETDYMSAAELYGPTIGAPCEKKFKALLKEKYNLQCICANELTDRVDVIKRGATALLNARLLPVVQEFIDIAIRDITKRGCKAPIMVVRSDGSLMSTDATTLKPVETILSGPAASILAGKVMSGEDSYIVIDMGGTTTDVSMVVDGMTKNVTSGINIGGWRTSVEGVFVDTFALGGDSTIRFEKGELKLFARRCIPLCTAASRFPQVVTQLQKLIDSKDASKYPLYEFLYLIGEPKNAARYNNQELKMVEILREGPCSLHELKERGVDLYSVDTTRLEDEGVLIRFGLTPTDFMHIKGEYEEFNREASILAVRYILLDNRSDVTIQITDDDVMKMADDAYNIVEEKMYTNLVRILLSQDYAKKFEDGLGDKLDFVIKKAWSDFKTGNHLLSKPQFTTDMLLLGMGAPTHVFLPDVAKALGTKCVLPDNAEIGNAIGAVMAELIVRSRVEITQWNDSGMYYIVHDENGSTRYDSLPKAIAHASKSAEIAAKKEAVLRGAKGELVARIIKEGNSHGTFAGENLTYGGMITAEVRFTLG